MELNYDLYLFDLDGTLINTETLHQDAYNQAFKYYNIDINLTNNDYCKYAHLNEVSMKNFVLSIDKNINYTQVYSKKKELYINMLNNNLKYITGADLFLQKLFHNNKKTCIVTHSDNETLDIIMSKLPLLKQVSYIVTRDICINKKPHPECYLRCINKFKSCKNIIGFEDSYKGYLALSRLDINITRVFIGSNNYPLIHLLNNNNNIFSNFTDIQWDNLKQDVMSNTIDNFCDISISRYTETINLCKPNFKTIIRSILSILRSNTNNIYLTGIGKCGHICKKSVSTWQSIGISCHHLYIPDLFHGDFGILKEGDIILYISNSGKTDELISCAKYIKSKFKITQICITIQNSDIYKYVDFHYVLSDQPIYEIDSINMAPTTSSILFLALLDMIGVKLSEEKNMTLEKFQKTHPGGDLGKIKNNIIDCVVILASGQGTRLYPMTKYIPKILITYQNKPFIQSLIEYWQNYCKKILIVCNKAYHDIIKHYSQHYFGVHILDYDPPANTGTAFAIDQILTQEYYNKNILLTWCDILPNQVIIDLKELEKSSTIFTYGNECRYAFDNKNKTINKVSENNGNIIGIYYLKHYKKLENYRLNDDICDVFMNNFTDTFIEYKLSDLTDIGDIDKYRKYQNNSYFKTRFFNEISRINESQIIKKLVNTDKTWQNIILKEMNWYKFINNRVDFIPKIYSYDNLSFKMEFIHNSMPLYKLFDQYDKNTKLTIITKIVNMLDKLHNLETINVNKDIVIKDLHIECYQKIIDRINKIKEIITYFGPINYVNNIKIFDLEFVLNKCFSIIKDKYMSQENTSIIYNTIHGDCQFSNIIINSDSNELFLIDPRGYFGNTNIYGLKDYDYAKVLYALTGYDYLNNHNEYYIDNIYKDNINIHIKDHSELFNDISPKIYNKVTMSLVVINWLGLAQYNENNILKSISSYYYGLYLFSKYLN
jgi:D-arabinose 5-phosphate isomerase GutQ/beta-phosphoglucomutase-like phosphatase (HAD superfamily)/choline kinase